MSAGGLVVFCQGCVAGWGAHLAGWAHGHGSLLQCNKGEAKSRLLFRESRMLTCVDFCLFLWGERKGKLLAERSLRSNEIHLSRCKWLPRECCSPALCCEDILFLQVANCIAKFLILFHSTLDFCSEFHLWASPITSRIIRGTRATFGSSVSINAQDDEIICGLRAVGCHRAKPEGLI